MAQVAGVQFFYMGGFETMVIRRHLNWKDTLGDGGKCLIAPAHQNSHGASRAVSNRSWFNSPQRHKRLSDLDSVVPYKLKGGDTGNRESERYW